MYFETNWEIAQFRVSPASEIQYNPGVKSLTGVVKVSQTRPYEFRPLGSHIGTVLNLYATAGSTRTNDFVDNKPTVGS